MTDNELEYQAITPRSTLREVAELAGVSVATASKALNDRVHVKATTKARVLDAARQLSFKPNEAARSLSGGLTGTVGLIADDLDGRFSLPILMGAEDAFGTGQVSVFLCDARADAIREQYHIDALLRRNVDGIIVVGARTDPRPPLPGPIPVPVVYAYSPSSNKDDVSVATDDYSAAKLAVKHLLSSGRKRIAHISGDSDYLAARERSAGIEAALKENGLELVGNSTFFGSWSEQWGRTMGARLLSQFPDLDGFVCGNDQISRGVLDAIQVSGKLAPQDVSIIGFDNWEVLTNGSSPTLSSIDLNLENLGRKAAELIFDSIENRVAGGIRRVSPKLITRESA